MTGTMNAPGIEKRSFSCPYCGVYAHQDWFQAGLHSLEQSDYLKGVRTPREWLSATRGLARAADEDVKQLFSALFELSYPYRSSYDSKGVLTGNCFFSRCYACRKSAVWLGARLIWPRPEHAEAPPANPDMPDEIARDYHEAARIAHLSPRGAAALLRLCMEKIFSAALHKDVRSLDIAVNELVRAKALSDEAGEAALRAAEELDLTRIYGKHSGGVPTEDTMNERDRAAFLFDLVNLLCEELVSAPKRRAGLKERARPKEAAPESFPHTPPSVA